MLPNFGSQNAEIVLVARVISMDVHVQVYASVHRKVQVALAF
jgi:hypothetical protein